MVYLHIHVESRKMVQINLFIGREQSHRCREWTCDTGGVGGWDVLGD